MTMENLIAHNNKNTLIPGEVHLVGAGPGDVELLTLKAWRILKSADVIVYDRLVSKAIMDEANPKADLIYVGKQSNHHCVPQAQINNLLIQQARSGKKVLRLKAGDPYIFGRGGEEAQELVAANIVFHVVPGITSASGASAYCGIPLTHRDYAHSVTFITGHLKQGELDVDWRSYVKAKQTLVIYMGLKSLPHICIQLADHGMGSDIPVAIIHKATHNAEAVVTGTLSNICERVVMAEIEPPAIIIIGEVVKLREIICPSNKDKRQYASQ